MSILGKAPRAFGWLLRFITAPSFVQMDLRCGVDYNVAFKRHKGIIKIAKYVQIYRNSELLAPVTIGEHTFINRDAYIRAHTTIGKYVNIGPFVKLLTDGHEISNVQRRAGKLEIKPIVIEDGVWIGACSIILGGVTLHQGCVIGAGSLVTKDVPANTLYVGSPARWFRDLEPISSLD